jgi:NAD(P)-dependent dehydrogenase (short-subunit alcohol dehydrogenase family)
MKFIITFTIHASDEIVEETGNVKLKVMNIDLSSLQSVRDFAKEFLANESKLDVLIHNAGFGGYSREITDDGIELTYAINHYGPFLLTHLLLDILKKSAPARIVIVASDVYRFAKVNINNLNPVQSKIPTWYFYYSSKAMNIMFTIELSNRLKASGVEVSANCLHPGYVHTPLWRRLPTFLWVPTNFLYKTFGKTAAQGAQLSVYLASSNEVVGISGKYFDNFKETTLREWIKNDEKCKILWEKSLEIVQIKDALKV